MFPSGSVTVIVRRERENLAGPDNEIPEELPDMQKRLVDTAAPGLRALLGYQ